MAAKAPVIAVVDYDMGNLHSVCKGLEQAGAHHLITDRYADLEQADAVLLPGVGAFDPAIQHLRSRDLIAPLKAIALSGKPFLGICLGLQILFDYSEEGNEPGLGLIPGAVRRFRPEPGITIPHMGWNQLDILEPDFSLWANVGEHPWLYFVHSFYVDPVDPIVRAATVSHGSYTVTAAVHLTDTAQHPCQLMATQFHPEKSSTAGLKILANFVELVSATAGDRLLASA